MKTSKSFFLLFLFLPCTILFGDIINVPADTSTIQGGIYLAETGDTVLVDEDTYYENINFRGKAIIVASQYFFDGDTSHITNTIIDGSQSSNPDSGSVVYFVSGEDTTSVLVGFTITSGNGTNIQYTFDGTIYDARAGGGILCIYSGCRLVSNYIISNSVSDENVTIGGGIAAGMFGSEAYLILENNRIINNSVSSTGAGASGGGVGMTCNGRLIDNVISYNSSTSATSPAYGGGITTAAESELLPKTVHIKRNTISHNFVEGNKISGFHTGARGGGIRSSFCRSIISDNKILYNQLNVLQIGEIYGEGWGAGIDLVGSDVESLISSNRISFNEIADIALIRRGAGISIFHTGVVPVINNIISDNDPQGISIGYCNPVIINNTIVNNQSPALGGGILITNTLNPAIIINTILWGNQSIDGLQISGNAEVYYSDIQNGWPGEGNIDQHPLFKFPAHGAYDLDKYSPCIGTGISSLMIGDSVYEAPEEDLYGRSRPAEDVDMGALESAFDKDMNDLVLYLSFDDSTANDASGYGNHGVQIGTPRDTAGILGNAFYFDGDSKIRIPDSESLDTDTSMTIALWIRPDSVTAGGAKFMCKWYSFRQQGDWLYALSSRDTVYNNEHLVQWVGYAANNGQFGGHCSIGVPRDSIHRYLKLHQWQHIAFTFDRGYMCSYVDGQFVDDSLSTVEYTSLGEYSTDDIYIGGYRTYYEGYKFFGSMDEVRIYDRALSAEEVESLYKYVTAIEERNVRAKVPNNFILFQNYPNPFNPLTAIGYQLPAVSQVELAIYNVLGQKVATLVSERQKAGEYQVQWDASGFASGIYYYQLLAGEYREVKKMILLR